MPFLTARYFLKPGGGLYLSSGLKLHKLSGDEYKAYLERSQTPVAQPEQDKLSQQLKDLYQQASSKTAEQLQSTAASTTGLVESNGATYYIDPETHLKVTDSSRCIDGSWYYFDSEGHLNRQAGIDKILGLAQSLLGVPYVWLGVYPQDGGMDCASFTWYLYQQLGIDIGFETYDQQGFGISVSSLSEAQPGDLILMYNGGWPNYNSSLFEHVVLYAGNGMIYEEPTFGGQCQYVSYYSKGASTISIRRVLA